MGQQVLKPIQNAIRAARCEVQHCRCPVGPSLGQSLNRGRKSTQPWLHLRQIPPHPLRQVQIGGDHVQRVPDHADEFGMTRQQVSQHIQIEHVKAGFLDPDRLAARHLGVKAEQQVAQGLGNVTLGHARKPQTRAHPNRDGVGWHISQKPRASCGQPWLGRAGNLRMLVQNAAQQGPTGPWKAQHQPKARRGQTRASTETATPPGVSSRRAKPSHTSSRTAGWLIKPCGLAVGP